MSRTLADVEAYQVYRDTDGDWVWHDETDVITRVRDGRIGRLAATRGQTAITGPRLGHVRDEPWRKADAGSLADAHDRIDALQARVDALEHALKPKAGEDVPKSDRPPVPAKQTQPPDVAVYELKYLDGRVRRYEYPSYDVNFNRPLDGACETRTVLDAFDRLGWDELRRWRLTLFGPAGYGDAWDVARCIKLSSHPTEHEALTAARDLARKEGWR